MTINECTFDLRREVVFRDRWYHNSRPPGRCANPISCLAKGNDSAQWYEWLKGAEEVQGHWAVDDRGETLRQREMQRICFEAITGMEDIWNRTPLVLSMRVRRNGRWGPWWSDC